MVVEIKASKKLYINNILDIDLWPHPETRPKIMVAKNRSQCSRDYKAGTLNILEIKSSKTKLKPQHLP